MKTIDLHKVISESTLTEKEIAEQLFPDNKDPIRGLRRVLNEGIALDANQISKLSSITGIPIGELFGDWSMRSTENEYTLKCDNYTVRINMDTSSIKMFHDESLFHEDFLFDKLIPISELINNLNIQIKNHESN